MKSYIFFFTLLLAASCNPSEKKATTVSETSKVEHEAYIEKGREISGQVFATLATTLQSKLKEGGVSSAVQYCNLEAMPIVDSLSKEYNVNIRRTTLQERNPANRPTEKERRILNEFAKEVSNDSKPESRIINDGKHKFYYQPIFINNFCLQCHGTIGKDITEEDYAVIKELYPQDKAFAYKDGDLRGMWSIRFKMNE